MIGTMASPWHYTLEDLTSGFEEAGIRRGDTVFFHVSAGLLGRPEGVNSTEDLNSVILQGIQKVIGPKGTVLIPTYTYSFGKGEVFDIHKTPSAIGDFSEYFRLLPGIFRSRDPMFSVAALGPQASHLLGELPRTCFGKGSLYDRMVREGAKICTLGLGWHWATFRHHIEEIAGVPHRFLKIFSGVCRIENRIFQEDWIFFARILSPACRPFGQRLEKIARDKGICRTGKVGRGEIVVADAKEIFDLGLEELKKDPWLAAVGPPDNLIKLEEDRVGRSKFDIPVEANYSMSSWMNQVWKIPRDTVSDGVEAILSSISRKLEMKIYQYPSGTLAGGELIPEKWSCREARLESLERQSILSYENNPIHIASYSIPYEGIVSRKTLFRHLYVHSDIPEAIPFVSIRPERDWAFCCSQEVQRGLNDEYYRVVIKTDFSFGSLKIGEVSAAGKKEDSILLITSLEQTGTAGDDLAGVAVGMEVIKRLLMNPLLEKSYRLIILPGFSWLKPFWKEELKDSSRVAAGIVLRGLGRDERPGIELSNNPLRNNIMTEAFGPQSIRFQRRFLDSHFLSDSLFGYSSGLGFDLFELNRFSSLAHPGWPYPEFESSADTAGGISQVRLENSVGIVMKMIAFFEKE